MRNEIKVNNTPKDGIINEIIEFEWEMFDKVHNQGGRAGCQDDEWTFYVMRFSQFSAFPLEMLSSYRQDLLEAAGEGRNLLMEKYAYMMEYTEPDYFNGTLRGLLPKISPKKSELVEKTADILVKCEQAFGLRYPAISGRGRELAGNNSADVSFRVYTVGELKTYSERTLNICYRHLQGINPEAEWENPSFKIHAATVEFYGYKSLNDAEIKIKGA